MNDFSSLTQSRSHENYLCFFFYSIVPLPSYFLFKYALSASKSREVIVFESESLKVKVLENLAF